MNRPCLSVTVKIRFTSLTFCRRVKTPLFCPSLVWPLLVTWGTEPRAPGWVGAGGVGAVGNTNINNTNVVRGGAYPAAGGGYYAGGARPYAGYGAAAVTAGAVTAGVVAAGTAAAYSASLPCSASPYAWNGASYYQCGSSWYTRGYVNGNVAYVVTGPPG